MTLDEQECSPIDFICSAPDDTWYTLADLSTWKHTLQQFKTTLPELCRFEAWDVLLYLKTSRVSQATLETILREIPPSLGGIPCGIPWKNGW